MYRRLSPGRVPRPLLMLLVSVFVLTSAWSLLVPPFQAPDERLHFGYVQTLAEELEIPGGERGEPFSTEQTIAANASNAPQVTANIFAKPEWSELEYERWRRVQAALGPAGRTDGGGSDGGGNPARTNPPLYYLYAAAPYLAGGGSDIFGRFYLMRLWSALLLLVSVGATWALVGELFGRDRLLQLTGAGFVGAQPMASFVSASVSPDSMLIAAFALSLWLGVRVLGGGLTVGRGVRVLGGGLTVGRGSALCAATAAAVLTKATAYALVPGVLLVLAVGLQRARSERTTRAEGGASHLRAAAVSAAVLALPIAAWVAIARLSDTPAINQVGSAKGQAAAETPGLISYLWQFYLPYLPFQTPLAGHPALPAYDYWIKGMWGSFGSLEVNFPEPVYLLLAAVTLLLLAAGAVALVRARRTVDLAAVAFPAAVTLCLLAGLHWVDFRNLGQPFMQGRYLLPLLPLLGLCAAGALRQLSPRRRPAVAGVLLGGLFSLQAGALALSAGRYFA